MNKLMLNTLLIASVGFSVQAAEMNHDMMGHGEMDHSTMKHDAMTKMVPQSKSTSAALDVLPAMPASGKAREGGYDGRYIMESSDVSNDRQTRCAQASRGLVMMENAEWPRCGGKPVGAAESGVAVKGSGKSGGGHAGHQM